MDAAASSRRLGIFQVALSGFCFGFLGLFGKKLFASGVSAGEMLSFRFTLAALILWPALILRMPGRWRLGLKPTLACAALGVAGYAIFSSCFFRALEGLSASLTVLLLYTYPIIVAVAAWVLWDDKIPRSKWAALPLTFAGLVLLVWGEISVERASGLAFGFGSAVLYSSYILASSRWLRGIPPLVSSTYIISSAGLALALLHLTDLHRTREVFLSNWPWLIAIAVVGTVAAMSLFLAGLQKLKPWEVSLLSTLEPVTGVAIAAVVLGERLSMVQTVGGAGVLAGLVIVSLPVSLPAPQQAASKTP